MIPLTSPVMMWDGTWNTVRNVEVGDRVVGRRGKPVLITRIEDSAEPVPVVLVTLIDGSWAMVEVPTIMDMLDAEVNELQISPTDYKWPTIDTSTSVKAGPDLRVVSIRNLGTAVCRRLILAANDQAEMPAPSHGYFVTRNNMLVGPVPLPSRSSL